MQEKLYAGRQILNHRREEPVGTFVEIMGERYMKIGHYDQMLPFFMTIVSDTDLWMFLSSTGSLTAGRRNPGQALFPYYTDDKIHDSAGISGSRTWVQAVRKGKTQMWEPFSERWNGLYRTERNLYKNTPGNIVLFEEINHDLELTFRYQWAGSERYGWIRKSTMINHGEACMLKWIDGLQNLLPWGVNRNMQGIFSTLVDAYKKCERVADSRLALYRLSSIPVDKAEPSEALKANIVWSTGLNHPTILLSNRQTERFSRGETVEAENETRGTRGAYLVYDERSLGNNEEAEWYLVADVACDAPSITKLLKETGSGWDPALVLEAEIQRGTAGLVSLVAKADGLQVAGDPRDEQRHFSNTLFNIMRGGIPARAYFIQRDDFRQHIRHSNQPLAARFETWLNQLPGEIVYPDLLKKSEEAADADLVRLTLEYLPLMFSRRHGDPSRPWNLFDIKLKNNDGSPSLNYQGNWRDIFQNWEALAMSYPLFVQGMITRFLNASTIDGYNPYRITRDGIDWELPDPSDPWANIGYWGDHQTIYLVRLLELSERFFPGKLEKWTDQALFTFADVPYEQKSYPDLLQNPRDTILFDAAKNEAIEKRTRNLGADGKLVLSGGRPLNVNFTEKILIPLLSKLSHFVPGAGIWMNTQRPEWNDANNALVGFGASMVTVYYLRRYVHFLVGLYEKTAKNHWLLQAELEEFFGAFETILQDHAPLLQDEFTDRQRKSFLDLLGTAGSRYREKVYRTRSGEKKQLTKVRLLSFLSLVQQYLDHSIAWNKRPDGLFHAYNLLAFYPEEIKLRRLPEMLEGQVAVLGSGYLNEGEAPELLDRLRNSALYRPDQRSYLLYPDRSLPLFLEKNRIRPEDIQRSSLLQTLLNDGNPHIVVSGVDGSVHFQGDINNALALDEKLSELPQKYHEGVEAERKAILDIYESVFDHQSFTGRSGSFYKYEGLGCIYWHMVSKLLLAVGENIRETRKNPSRQEETRRLRDHYFEIREGIGSHKTPAEYGAFPTDPYSHTPSMGGVQQPGMTGQVKEDLLSRWIELGLEVENGCIRFENGICKTEGDPEQNSPGSLHVFRQHYPIEIPGDAKPFHAFTFCGTPILILPGDSASCTVLFNETNDRFTIKGLTLNPEHSHSVFSREGKIKQINIRIKKNSENRT